MRVIYLFAFVLIPLAFSANSVVLRSQNIGFGLKQIDADKTYTGLTIGNNYTLSFEVLFVNKPVLVTEGTSFSVITTAGPQTLNFVPTSSTRTINFSHLSFGFHARIEIDDMVLTKNEAITNVVCTELTDTDYRYAFNGMEKDDEVKDGVGNHYDFGARCYDSRLGRWFTPDPSEKRYPGISTYAFSFNSPLAFHDPDGKDGRLTIDFENKVITMETTVHLYGANENINTAELVKNFNAEFDKNNNVVRVKDPNDPEVVWTVKIDVNFVYNEALDKAEDEMNIGEKEDVHMGSYEEFAEKGVEGLETGDNVYKLIGQIDSKTLGHTTVGGNEASGNEAFDVVIHESLHMLGYDERYYKLKGGLGAPMTYTSDDYMSSGSTKMIMSFHFVDLLDWTLQNYTGQTSGCYVVGNQSAEVKTETPIEYEYQGETIDMMQVKTTQVQVNTLRIDDTKGGTDLDTEAEINKKQSRVIER